MFVEVDGTAVFVGTGGLAPDAARPAVAFVHGAGMDHTVWQPQARYLAHRGHAVLAVDLPGHGRSGGAALATIPETGAWLLRFLTATGRAQAAVVGHSMGALAALEAAAQDPARVTRLALLGVAARMPVHPELLAAAASDPTRAAELIASWGHGSAAQRGGNIAPGIWRLSAAVRLLTRAAPGVLACDLAACDGYRDAAAAAARSACPALLLLGAEDRMTPVRAAAPLMEAFAGRAGGGACQRVLDRCGHMMMSEAPEATSTALRAFLTPAGEDA